ncbi:MULTISPECIES: hypothetical protein [unclassified Rhizobium]|uniref:hypothetical protein n=1 Tax=unclassified Rhizobium TaxID=2613769 RepID=UPI00115C4D46|nr:MULTISPECIES: hypothetical protein [unclassified Rhizobium]TQX88449.1 hypothetical protein EQW76_11470 [Rhizobium sp. rho-13.1]TQY12644.1 hypothetical protein EQW74_15115 [Rhizobium sp. rho-1.1]
MAGNANSGRKQEKPFRDALRMALAEAGDNQQALRVIAGKLIDKAKEGDMQAIKELADRLDGKATQALVGEDSEGRLVPTIIFNGQRRDTEAD